MNPFQSWLHDNYNEVCLWIVSATFFLFSKIVVMDMLEIVLKSLSIVSIVLVIILQLKKIRNENRKAKEHESGD